MKYIGKDELIKTLQKSPVWTGLDAITRINAMDTIDIVWCKECRKVREDGGHANCNGYLYCRKWKTLVDEDGYCSWGEREGE